jgi:hypothetical protein
MRFRRIYWVTEQMEAGGKSRVVGIYTSIPDLIETGLPALPDKAAGFRVSLCELDSNQPPVTSFESPDFSGVSEALEPIVKGGEFTVEEARALSHALTAI